MTLRIIGVTIAITVIGSLIAEYRPVWGVVFTFFAAMGAVELGWMSPRRPPQ